VAPIAGKFAKGRTENVEKLSVRRPDGDPYPAAEANFVIRFKSLKGHKSKLSALLLAGNIARELPKSDRIYSGMSRDVSRIGTGNNGNGPRL
jgi:hypothetical protein